MEMVFENSTTSWSNVEPTPKQKLAIESYEKAAKVKILVKNKQDAHNVISQFCKNGITFENGFIKGTNITYSEEGKCVNGKTLSNDINTDTIQPRVVRISGNLYNIMSGLSRETFNFSDDDDDCFGGADPYTMFY